MSVFEIESESGFTRVLKADAAVPITPWLLDTVPRLSLHSLIFNQLVVSERGLLPQIVPNLQNFPNPDTIVDKAPEWSFFTPRLYPASEILEKSMIYEMNLFLDRLETIDLPEAFGLSYDPIYQSFDVLDELLSFGPSIISLRLPVIEDTSPRKYIDYIINVRNHLPPDIALYVPGAGGIGFNTLLTSLGVDIFDDMPAYRFAARQRAFVDGFVEYIPDMEVTSIIEKNRKAMKKELENINFHLQRNTLWTRLHREMHTHPHIASGVTLLANDYKEKVPLHRIAVHQDNQVQFTGEEGLYHPDVLHFQNRIRQYYHIPDYKKILLLLPCSAKKPYIESRSHRKFEQIIGKGLRGFKHLVEVWSLTSPLGVVPRGLETVYPAANYDIPVTGNWSERESKVTGEFLGDLLLKVPDDVTVIAHVSSGYQDMLEIASKYRTIDHYTALESPTSHDQLGKLLETLQTLASGYDHQLLSNNKYYVTSSFESINAIIRYDHGIDKDLIVEPSIMRILGRPPRPIQVQMNKKHYLSWDKLHGKINLSPKASIDVSLKTKNWVLTDTGRLRGSNLYAVAVNQASEEISPGDEVLFFNADKTVLIGIGTATVSGWTMNRIDKGKAAEIRKKMEVVI